MKFPYKTSVEKLNNKSKIHFYINYVMSFVFCLFVFSFRCCFLEEGLIFLGFMKIDFVKINRLNLFMVVAQSPGAVEYTDCISTEGWDLHA